MPRRPWHHHSQQVPIGVRAPGPLVTTPPAGLLPPVSVSSYAPLLYDAGASTAGVVRPPPVGPLPPLYTTAQTPWPVT
jgi:hypothetical protein